MVRTLARGDVFVVGDGGRPNRKSLDEFSNERVIRADRIDSFLRGRVSGFKPQIGATIEICGALVVGKLDLRNLTLDTNFALPNCHTDEIELFDADIRSLNLSGSFSKGIRADRICVRGGVFLRNGFECEGAVRFSLARIGGHFSCINSSFKNAGDVSLTLENSTIRGSAFLRHGFSSIGEVRLQGAEIGGSIDCQGASLFNPDGHALNAEGVSVSGSVVLSRGFKSKGVVRLLGANIDEDLDCHAGLFENPEGVALGADSSNIGGNVLMTSGYTAFGETRFINVTVDGNVNCSGGRFINDKKYALLLSSCKIHNNLILRDWFDIKGCAFFLKTAVYGILNWAPAKQVDCEIDLRFVQASVFLDGGNWPSRGNLKLDGFQYESIADPTDISVKARIAWLERQPAKDLSVEFKPQPWRQCIKVLREAGHVREANKVIVAMGRRQRPSLSLPEKIWDWVKDRFLGYGYNPTGLFLAIFLIWVAGWGVFQGGYSWGAILPSEAPVFTKGEYRSCLIRPALSDMRPHKRLELCMNELYPEYMEFNPLIFSLDVFVPLVDLHQESSWEPRSVKGVWFWGHGVRLWYWFQILAGWVLTTLAVVALTGAVRPKHEEE